MKAKEKKKVKKDEIKIVGYTNWLKKQEFYDYAVPYQKDILDFLQHVIYPMFYKVEDLEKLNIRELYPYPLVYEKSERYPVCVIENKYFSIVFMQCMKYTNTTEQQYWEVSVNIKNHKYCDERIRAFRKWYVKYYNEDWRYSRVKAEMISMPKEFVYPALELYLDKVCDFSIEFRYSSKNYMLFKLFDLMRE